MSEVLDLSGSPVNTADSLLDLAERRLIEVRELLQLARAAQPEPAPVPVAAGPTDMHPLLTLDEAAERLSLGRGAVYAIIQRQPQLGLRVGRSLRVWWAELVAYLHEQRAIEGAERSHKPFPRDIAEQRTRRAGG